MLKSGCLLILVALAAAGCGSDEAPPPRKPVPTVFDPLVQKKETVPAAIEAAQVQHDADARRAIESADGSPPPEGRR